MTTAAIFDQEAHDLELVVRRVAAAGSSFETAMRVLPRGRRYGMFAVYAFCREVDDIADEPAPQAQKLEQLEAWRAEIARLYDGLTPTLPVGRALVRPIRDFGLQKRDFLDVIDGMQMDAEGDIRAPDQATLTLYCDRVASAVGRLSVRVFGTWRPRSDDVADHLGQALQLTNILRDIDEDAARGRLYLPRETLRRHGIEGDDPLSVISDPRIDGVCREIAIEAERRYVEAARAMAACGRRDMRPAAMMGAVYHAYLERMLRRGWLAPRAEVRVPKREKIWRALKAGFLTR